MDTQQFTIKVEETGVNTFKYELHDHTDDTVYISDANVDIFDMFDKIETKVHSKYLSNKSATII